MKMERPATREMLTPFENVSGAARYHIIPASRTLGIHTFLISATWKWIAVARGFRPSARSEAYHTKRKSNWEISLTIIE
jgi:hypothetical protein